MKIIFFATRENQKCHLKAIKLEGGNWFKFNDKHTDFNGHPIWLQEKLNSQVEAIINHRKLFTNLKGDQLNHYYNRNENKFIYLRNELKEDDGNIKGKFYMSIFNFTFYFDDE